MAKYFDEEKWIKILKQPDWYLEIIDEIRSLRELANKNKNPEIIEEIYQFFEKQLEDNKIALAKEGPNWDKERKPIDTIVIHHTSLPPGITWQRLSAIQLINIYATYYANPYYEEEKHLKGKPIYSGHFRNGKQVFYAYHWLIRMDGSWERLLNDDEIGWQAGNWEINCRSIAICLDNDFENSSPPDFLLESIAKLIKEKYPQVKPERIFGHLEIKPKITCPGNKFLTDWKPKLIELL